MGDAPLEEYLPALMDMGYNGIEVVMDPRLFPAGPTRAIVAANGLDVLSVAAPGDLDLAHPLPSLRHRSIEEARRVIEYAVEVGSPRVVFREKVGRVRPIVGRTKEWALLRDSLRPLAQSAAQWGVDILLLAVNRYEGFLVNTADQALQAIDEVEGPVKVALSTYHMHMEEDNMRAALESVGERLGLVYAAENQRRALGSGQIDWVEICQGMNHMGYDGPLVVECQAPGADPFLPVGRAPDWQAEVLACAETSIQHLRVALTATLL